MILLSLSLLCLAVLIWVLANARKYLKIRRIRKGK